jgi:hypothetical protein
VVGNGIRPAKIRPECFLNPKISSYKIFITFGLILGLRKKKIVKNGQNGRNFCKKIKFKIRLVAGNGIWPAKIRPEGPLNPLESACKKILTLSQKFMQKIPKNRHPLQKPSFGGGSDLKWTKFDNIDVAWL